MPVILRYKNFKFFFYSNEGNPLEPAHIHVRNSDGEAKFWLMPAVRLGRSDGLNRRDIKELTEVIEQNKMSFLEAWNDYFI
ncbi:DUF4160 domain-containing protein [Sodalis sp. RH22]|uniref:DUF4160 domain-containing protein n=1 Tax=unclassified Sodalis (in: enterobacteria) TaxID=2636512 RepID=UPI0039B5F2B2